VDTDQLAAQIGQTIARRRLACDLTQEDVAEQLGIGLAAVSRMERGVIMPTVSRLVELAGIFQCNAADLMTEVSTGAHDQAQHLTQVLSTLGSSERATLVDVVERLAACLNHSRSSMNG
jgi:transcriptional regulator with XRE-family HTH domain